MNEVKWSNLVLNIDKDDRDAFHIRVKLQKEYRREGRWERARGQKVEDWNSV